MALDIGFVTASLSTFPIEHPAVVGDSVAERLCSFSTPALPHVLRAEGVCVSEALCLPPAASVGSAGSGDNHGQGNSGFVKVHHGHGCDVPLLAPEVRSRENGN